MCITRCHDHINSVSYVVSARLSIHIYTCIYLLSRCSMLIYHGRRTWLSTATPSPLLSVMSIWPGRARCAVTPLRWRTNVLATVHYHRRCETIRRRALQSRLNGQISNCATCNCHVRRIHDHVRTTAVTNCPHSFRCLILRVDSILFSIEDCSGDTSVGESV